jgi:hypothetical protein
MPVPADSFKQFNYSLRPSKQVERRMMIEVLLRMSSPRFPISTYRYLGMGSPYYVDFVMVHKQLFIDDMVCVEWSDIPKRMAFNKPFKCITLKLMSISDYIPRVTRSKRHFAWFDYDRALDTDMLRDLDGCLTVLAPRSVFVVTIDARPKLPVDAPELDEVDLDALTANKRADLTAKLYQTWFGNYLDTKVTKEVVSNKNVATLFHSVVAERIRQTVSVRGLKFIQLFNYVYQDGAPMLTVGGVLATEEDEAYLRQQPSVLEHRFVRQGADYMTISVPHLTVREKHWLDSRMDQNLTPDKLQFELDSTLLENYRQFYKEYPTYLETVV